MNWFVLCGGALGLYLFYPLGRGIIEKKFAQNPLTFALWSMLDGIAAGAALLADGNWLQAFLFMIGGLAILTCTVVAKNPLNWTWFENLILALVILSVGIWVSTTNELAVLASVIALTIASVPQIVDTWRNPIKTPSVIYFGYVVSNLLATLGGKEFSVVEVAYPVGGFVICAIIFVFSLRK